jgi:hypothetical protein
MRRASVQGAKQCFHCAVKDKRIAELEAENKKLKRVTEHDAEHIAELEALISQGFQDLKGRDVADALIDNANLRDRIKELEVWREYYFNGYE